MNRKLAASLLATALFSAALPLAASAMSLGVSDEVDTTIYSGHLQQCSESNNSSSGTTWSNSKTTKVGSENDNGTTSASVVDPAASSGTSTGKFNVTAVSEAGTQGVYNNTSSSTSELTGGMQAGTSIVNTVSTFVNP
jgi:hypothetical protein